MNFGVKISLPGIDVNKASPEECAVYSKYDTFKINETATPPHFGQAVITIRNNPPRDVVTNLYKIPHGYSHRPSVLSHIDTGVINSGNRGSIIAGRVSSNPSASNELDYLECCVDDTYLYINIRQHTSDWTGAGAVSLSIPGAVYPNIATVRFYIFANDGSQ